MNQSTATAKFFLHVSSQNQGEVWPINMRDNPAMDARIQENYYADEDEASATFEISDMEDLLAVMKLYQGKSVRLSLNVTVEAPEFSTHANLSEKWQRGVSGSFRMIESDDVSPATAANKLIAIAHSLSRWQSKNQPKP